MKRGSNQRLCQPSSPPATVTNAGDGKLAKSTPPPTNPAARVLLASDSLGATCDARASSGAAVFASFGTADGGDVSLRARLESAAGGRGVAAAARCSPVEPEPAPAPVEPAPAAV